MAFSALLLPARSPTPVATHMRPHLHMRTITITSAVSQFSGRDGRLLGFLPLPPPIPQFLLPLDFGEGCAPHLDSALLTCLSDHIINKTFRILWVVSLLLMSNKSYILKCFHSRPTWMSRSVWRKSCLQS